MTIRSGGRPRDNRRAQQAHPAQPVEERTTAKPWEPEYARPRGGGNGGKGNGNGYGSNGGGYGRRRGGGFGGILRFLVFALILGAIVLALLLTALRPMFRNAVLGWASDNPAALDVPFVADLVKEDLGSKLTAAASTDTTQQSFTVADGESASTIAASLEDQGFLTDRRAFVLLAVEKGLAGQLRTGDFILRKSMTPDQLVTSLLDPNAIQHIDIALRTGLRLEQITAKLETIDGLTMNPEDFYNLAKHPTADLLADYAWLELPKGASLEGFLWPATYRVLPDTTADELVRLMLDKFHEAIEGRMDVPAARGMSFYEVLTLASLVDREAILDEERPLIAGVYQNRLNGKLPHRLLQADPTVIYAFDTLQLATLDVARWREYNFWTVPKDISMKDIALPPELQGYQTYQNPGLMPGPICTPTLASIDAALEPDTSKGYVFFLAKRDGSNGHAFARTSKEHQANRVKYGY
jgi:peptidoglycan lytic transglycosylase G